MGSNIETTVISEPTVWSDPEYNVTGIMLFRSNLTIAGTPELPVRVHFANEQAVLRVYGEHVQLKDVEFYGASERIGRFGQQGLGLDMPENVGKGARRIEMERFTCRGLRICYSGERGNTLTLSDSVFIENHYAVQYFRGTVDNCLFLNNEYAIHEVWSCNVTNSMFANNGQGIGVGDSDSIENTTFVRNGVATQGFRRLKDVLFYRNGYGVMSGSSLSGRVATVVEGVTFRNNAVALSFHRAPEFDGMELNFIDNDIHLSYWGEALAEAKNLYWGTTNVSLIREHIGDVFFNPMAGFIDIEPVAELPFQSRSLLLPDEDFLGYKVLDVPITTFATSYIPTSSPHAENGASTSPIPTTGFSDPPISGSTPRPSSVGSHTLPTAKTTQSPSIDHAEMSSQSPNGLELPTPSPQSPFSSLRPQQPFSSVSPSATPQPPSMEMTLAPSQHQTLAPSQKMGVPPSQNPMWFPSTAPSISPMVGPTNMPVRNTRSESPISLRPSLSPLSERPSSYPKTPTPSEYGLRSSEPSSMPSIDLITICREQFDLQERSSSASNNPLLIASLCANFIMVAIIGLLIAQKYCKSLRR